MVRETMINVLIAWHIAGYEASAVSDVFKNPLKAINVAMNGPKIDGPMAKEIDLSNSRDPEFVFDTHVQKMLNEIHNGKA